MAIESSTKPETFGSGDHLGEQSTGPLLFSFQLSNLQDSLSALTHCRRTLRRAGELVLTLPHPSLPWLRAAEAPFYFKRPSLPYHGARDMRLEGQSGSVRGSRSQLYAFTKPWKTSFDSCHKPALVAS